jgi:hypothetical protein
LSAILHDAFAAIVPQDVCRERPECHAAGPNEFSALCEGCVCDHFCELFSYTSKGWLRRPNPLFLKYKLVQPKWREPLIQSKGHCCRMASTPLPVPSRLFEALASKNYDDLIQLYGEAAITALQSYQQMQLRWNHHRDSNSGRGKRMVTVDYCK